MTSFANKYYRTALVSAAWPLLLIQGYQGKGLCLEEQGPLSSLGPCNYAKIPLNFGPNVNGTVWPRWKFSSQSGPTLEVVLFDRSVRSD